MSLPKLRFPEFAGDWTKKKTLDLSRYSFSNGVFNDPNKVGSGYRLINVKDMFDQEPIGLREGSQSIGDWRKYGRQRRS